MPYVNYQDWWNQRNKTNPQGYTPPAPGAPSESSVYQPYKSPSYTDLQANATMKPIERGVQGFAASGGNPYVAAAAAGVGALEAAPEAYQNITAAQEAGDYKGSLKATPWYLLANPFTGPAAFAYALGGTALRRQPQTQVEEKRWGKLRDAGFEIPAWVKDGTDIKDPNAGYDDKLAADHIGTTDQGWNNNQFAQSRDEKDLRPEDLLGYASPVETFGTSWTGADEGTRKTILQNALNAGAVDEHHGTVDINWSPELKQSAMDLLGQALAKKPENANRQIWVKPTNAWKPPGT